MSGKAQPFGECRQRLNLHRVFLAGDTAHTHSPKGGQGMNISIQDTYNLIWKLGEVITGQADPIILETYDTERRPVAKELMRLDSQLVRAYEQEETDTPNGIIDDIREQYAGFMAGVGLTYSHNALISEEGKRRYPRLAKNMKPGMRIPSFPVVYQCDGSSTHLVRSLISDRSWRLLVFSGDLHQPEKNDALFSFADTFSKHSHLANQQSTDALRKLHPPIEPLLIQSNPRSAVSLLDLPEIFHPFDTVLGWDYWKIFADDGAYDGEPGQAYKGYGIDEGGLGCLVLCRPDQHVAWIGCMQDVGGLYMYFSGFLSATSIGNER